jgi:hypothetical protein
MVAIYLLVILAPLAPAALHSSFVAHAMTGKCTGDCSICGCSPERSAARACCCWQKKLAEAKLQHRGNEHQSCPTTARISETKAAGSCCSKSADHDDPASEAAVTAQTVSPSDTNTEQIGISTCPCGSGKNLTLFGSENTQHVPFRFLNGVLTLQSTPLVPLQPERLASRYGEPPDPPPEVFIFS